MYQIAVKPEQTPVVAIPLTSALHANPDIHYPMAPALPAAPAAVVAAARARAVAAVRNSLITADVRALRAPAHPITVPTTGKCVPAVRNARKEDALLAAM